MKQKRGACETWPSVFREHAGGDHDFVSGTGKYLDANGVLQSYDAAVENDTMVLAYRVAAVPEPETYALLLAGLAQIGAVSGRRRLKAA
jgi:hypothetical protein